MYKKFKKLIMNKLSLFSIVFLIILSFAAILSPILMNNNIIADPEMQDLSKKLMPPSIENPFGTDMLGRDILSRILFGTKITISIGILATLVTVIIGVCYGLIAGYFGGMLDNVMMRLVDVLYSLPFIFFVILLLSLFERSFMLLFIALGAVQWLTMSRIVRGQILSIKNKDFVSAARALGAGNIRIMLRHVLPNIVGIIIVYATLTVPVIILQESFLAFLGLTVPGQQHSWGAIISEGVNALNSIKICWWIIVFPGLFISFTLMSLNFIGDGIRNIFITDKK